MLELKFVMFIDFPLNMSPGIFISCADDIELFESKGKRVSAIPNRCLCRVSGSNFTHPGFTAMSHPAEAEIGLTHGVFVLERNLSAEISSNRGHQSRTTLPVLSCRRFLHKPSMDLMRSASALLSGDQVRLPLSYH